MDESQETCNPAGRDAFMRIAQTLSGTSEWLISLRAFKMVIPKVVVAGEVQVTDTIADILDEYFTDYGMRRQEVTAARDEYILNWLDGAKTITEKGIQ